MNTYMQEATQVHAIESDSWSTMLVAMVSFVTGLTGLASAGAVFVFLQNPTISLWYLLGSVVVGMLALTGVMHVVLRAATLARLVYKTRKSAGFSYSPLSQCDSLLDWVFYTWKHEVKASDTELLFDRKSHYGYRYFGFEILLVGNGGWHKSNSAHVLPYGG